MTGRLSGRCAATEALREIRDHGLTDEFPCRAVEDADCVDLMRERARAALASPCCVSATDQEQVKEALEWLCYVSEDDGRQHCRICTGFRDIGHVNGCYVGAALALLGSHEQEEG